MALKFKIMGVPVAIGVDFILIMLLLGALWREPEQLPAWMAVATGSVLLHELGHAALFDFFGFKPAIRLHGGGGLTMAMTSAQHRLSPSQHILVAAAGPAMGLIVGGLAGVAVLADPRLAANDIVQDLLWVSLGWSLVNLLPFPGVDGGAIVSELTTVILGRPAETAGRVVGLIVVGAVFIGLVLVGLYYWAFIIAFFAVFRLVQTGLLSSARGAVSGAGSASQMLLAGRYQEAFNAARVAMADRPGDPGPILTASTALRLMSRYADAEAGYDMALRSNPTDAGALRGRASNRRHLGRDADADADLQALLGLRQDGAAVSQAAGLYDANRHDEGYRLVLDALPVAHNPVVAGSLMSYVAMFEYSLGREDEALNHVDELLVGAPEDAALRELRALILIDLGHSDEAIVEARRAVALMPHHPVYLETLGIAVRTSGDAATALQPLTYSATMRHSDPRARAELAVCYIQLGRVGEARAALETLPGYALRDPFAAYARAALAAAGGASAEAIGLLVQARRLRPELGVRAGVDPVFRTLLADAARRAAIA